MKNFNLEEAKSGKPVCTRRGEPARIICWDSKVVNGCYPIVALVTTNDDSEYVKTYTLRGEYREGQEDERDLMMAGEKKEGWVNIYRMYDGEIMAGNSISKTREDALKDKKFACATYITTAKIDWEE